MAKKSAKVPVPPVDTTTASTKDAASPMLEKSGSAAQDNGSLATDPLPVTRVNKANLGEIKAALDEIVKKYLTAQSFTPSLLHPTVHLSLGYTSIIFSLGSVLYSLRVPFEESKPFLWVGVVGYFVLQGILWAYKRWVEAGEVFQGKRRRMVKRIETDIVHVVSSTSLDPPPPPHITHSPHTRPSSPSTLSSLPSSPTGLSPTSSDTALHSRDTSATSATSATSTSISSQTTRSCTSHTGPTYSLHLSLSTTSNNGKSLLHKSRVVAGRGIGEFVDVNGGVEEGEVARWISTLLVDAGLVGAEEEGSKEE